MSLSGALNIGRSALAVQQAAIQVTSNNIANAGNADYTRQTAGITSAGDQKIGNNIFLGNGVDLSSVKRQIDDALEGRIRGSVSENESADTYQQWLGRVESTFNELGDDDLSTRLSDFFGSWSNLANKPQDIGLRQVVLQNGDATAKWFNDLRNQLGSLQTDVDGRLNGQVNDANSLAQQIADLNGQIVTIEGGGTGPANGLRDNRDALLKQLSQLVDVRTVQQDNGVANVYVGSEPLVFGTNNRGLALKQTVTNGELTSSVIFKQDGGTVTVKEGQIGGLLDARAKIGAVADDVDSIAHNLIFELNKIHSGGQGLEGFATSTSTNQVANTTLALNDPATGLAYAPVNGSFVVHVTQKATGLSTSTLVQVHLGGTGSQTSLQSLQADLDGIPNVHASILGGKLTVASDSDAMDVSFSQDTSGTLAAIGMNSFFTGKDASDISVNQAVVKQPTLLAAAKNGEAGDNQTALAIAALQSQPLDAFNGTNMTDHYEALVDNIGTAAASAKTDATATKTVVDTLSAQREALSGVSMDEEAINLVRQQRAFQGAAKVISTVDEMMQTVLGMVR